MALSRRTRVLCIFGTRPEAIKMAPVVRELRSRPEQFEARVLSTSQHREMLQQVLDAFELRPDHDLELMRPDQSLPELTQGVLGGVSRVLAQERPDFALVQGDTTTALAAALACSYARVPVGHVEAGLRTGDKTQPFPEEMNRRLIDQLCDLLFAPTERNRRALREEGLSEQAIVVTGNTVIDALLGALPRARTAAPRIAGLEQLDWSRKTLLVTCHRREVFGEELERICSALAELPALCPDLNLVYPVHRNPNVRGPVTRHLGGRERIYLIEPLEYLPFLWLMDRSYLILTDSGGIQEEAPSLHKPVVVMRNKTERTEAVDAGAVLLAGTDPGGIIREVLSLVQDPQRYARMAIVPNPFGDGLASRRIADALVEWQVTARSSPALRAEGEARRSHEP